MQQAKALAILKAGHNVFLTGSAGAGKTYVLNQYIQYLKERQIPVAVTASTGIAATHMNGMTIHTWSGIGISDFLSPKDIEKMKTRKYLRKHLDSVKVLIIDEISMLHKTQLDLVNQVLKAFKNNQKAFGGIQVVFSGDFFQLPPIGDTSESTREKFAFMANAWVEAELVVCYLSEQYRQEKDPLSDVLNEIRKGELSENSLKVLETAANNKISGTATKLFTHNYNVDQLNQAELKKLSTKSRYFEAEMKGTAQLREILKNSVRADERIELKLGAQLMFVKNNFEKGFTNGSLGELIDYNNEGWPIVRLNSGQEITVEPENWTMDDEMGSSLAAFKQIPLRLAWAITVHKSQGMTLDAADIDLSNCFERGQGYVALSRLRNLNGLLLRGFNKRAFELDPLAMRADARFQELSVQAELKYDAADLEAMAKNFVFQTGGIDDVKVIDKLKKKKKEKTENKKKESTYELSKKLFEQKMSVAEVAEERGLSEATVVSHLVKIKELDPSFDSSFFRPDERLLQTVNQAVNALIEENDPDKIRTNGLPGMRAIYEYLKEELPYASIHLAMMFRE